MEQGYLPGLVLNASGRGFMAQKAERGSQGELDPDRGKKLCGSYLLSRRLYLHYHRQCGV
jgi:hypothetical protein